MAEKFDAIIVGGGLSGLGTGALLAKAGKKVIVLEKHGYLGGRATSFNYKGYTLNIGEHAGLEGGKVDQLFDKVGKDMGEKGTFDELVLFRDGKVMSVFDLMPIDKPDEAMALSQAMEEISDEEWAKLDNMTADEWLKQYVTDPKLWFLTHMAATTCASTRRLEDMAASTLVEASLVVQRSTITYMLGNGYGGACNILADAIKEKGGEVKTKARVHDIIVKDKKVCGVSVEFGDAPPDGNVNEMDMVEAPVVVTAFPIWDLFKVIRQEYFSPEFVQKCLHLDKRTGNIGFHAGFSEPIITEKRFYFADIPQENDVPLPLTVLASSNVVPSVAPEGKHLVEFLCLIEPERVEDPREMRRIIQDIKDFAEQIFPGWEKKADWIRTFYHWEEPMRTAGRAGTCRPGPKAPSVEGLYFTGDTVGSRTLPGLENAADSALMCAKEILGELP